MSISFRVQNSDHQRVAAPQPEKIATKKKNFEMDFMTLTQTAPCLMCDFCNDMHERSQMIDVDVPAITGKYHLKSCVNCYTKFTKRCKRSHCNATMIVKKPMGSFLGITVSDEDVYASCDLCGVDCCRKCSRMIWLSNDLDNRRRYVCTDCDVAAEMAWLDWNCTRMEVKRKKKKKRKRSESLFLLKSEPEQPEQKVMTWQF